MHDVHPTCIGEQCRVCGAPASHKVGEEQTAPAGMHNLTSYLCCRHFVEVIGPAACEIHGCPRPEGTTSFYDQDGFVAAGSAEVAHLLRFKYRNADEWAQAVLRPLENLLLKAVVYHPDPKGPPMPEELQMRPTRKGNVKELCVGGTEDFPLHKGEISRQDMIVGPETDPNYNPRAKPTTNEDTP